MSESSWDRLVQEVDRGVLTNETINHFRDAEQYGTAAPMEWLKNRLEMLGLILLKGGTLSIQNGEEEFKELTNMDAFDKWVSTTLPQAFEGIAQNRGGLPTI